MTPTAIFGRTALLAAALVLLLATASGAQAVCSDPAAPYVDWSNCDKYGANLTNATLTNADLTNATLMDNAGEYAADLSGATWTDGRVCAAGSMGACN